MLKVRDITKSYFNQPVLKGISFEIPTGSIAGIIGPNGAGKSTLLDIISGFQMPDRGEIYYNDTLLENFSIKKSIFCYMPENLIIYPDYTVNDFVKLIFKLNGFLDAELMEVLELSQVKKKKIKHLSKGFHQRLKLFFALSCNKRIVILDEPFDGFDPLQIIKIFDFIRYRKEKGRTFILSIHQLHDAEKICNYFILLNRGRLITYGSTDTLKKKFNMNSFSLEGIFIEAMK